MRTKTNNSKVTHLQTNTNPADVKTNNKNLNIGAEHVRKEKQLPYFYVKHTYAVLHTNLYHTHTNYWSENANISFYIVALAVVKRLPIVME